MALISERKQGRKDGGYTRLLGNVQLGALISQVQATVIAAGTELEKQIERHAQTMTDAELTQFVNGQLRAGTYLITKKQIKKRLKPAIGSQHEPDFLAVLVKKSQVFVIEVKDGDTFDTKKSAGEVAACNAFAAQLAAFFLKNNLPYDVSIRICCFNQTSKDAIVKGFKSEITSSQAWTGEDLCKALSISYQTLLAQREADQKQNLVYFVNQLQNIPEVRKHWTA